VVTIVTIIRKLHRFVLLALVFALTAGMSVAQGPVPRPKRHPSPAPPELLNNLQGKAKFLHPTSRASVAIGAMNGATNVPGIGPVSSVPLFNGAFNFQGATFPFTMVGQLPASGRTAHVETVLIPIILVFPDFVDQNGNPFVLDATTIVPPTVNSPLWVDTGFPNGTTQYGDAIMRAEFPQAARRLDWHDKIERPRILNPVVIEVPGDDGNLFFIPPNGSVFAVLDDEFWVSQLNTILELEKIEVNEFVIVLSSDMFIAPNADPSQGFALGFHDAFATAQTAHSLSIQTFAWASWVSATALQGQFSDILPLSHEVAEWFNDPFGINPVPPFNPNPPFQSPPPQGSFCQGNLEVGDPLAGVPFPVRTNGTVYNPQVVALLPWFKRSVPSDAFEGDYSFPDPTVLTAPPPVCVDNPPPAAATNK
jgi:hypothetical protein